MLNCFGNFLGKGETKIATISEIKKKTKLNQFTINPINEVRYLSYCNLAENLIEHFDIINSFIQKHQDAGRLTEVQQKYFVFFKHPIIKLSLFMLKTLSENILKKIMKKGNYYSFKFQN